MVESGREKKEFRSCQRVHETTTMTEMKPDVYIKDQKNVKTYRGVSMGSL